MAIGVARVSRLANTSWLLILIGLSCRYTYGVGLPGPAGDAGGGSAETGGAQAADASVDQSSPSDKNGSNYPDQCASSRHFYVQSNSVEMIIALDRSTSMQSEAFSSSTKWLAARQAIVASTAAHPSIRFSVEQFPSLADCGGQACCADWPSLQPYHSSLGDQLTCGSGDAGCASAGDDSPSYDALKRCHDYFDFQSSQDHSFQFVLLVTDKGPSCAGYVAPGSSPCSQAQNEASSLGKNLGVQTFIVALNSDGHTPDCLASIADANSSNFPGNPSQLAVAANDKDLSDSLEAIMTSVEANLCRFSLKLTSNDPTQVSIASNQQHVPFDATGTQGWRFDPTSGEVVLSGFYCKDLTSAQGHTNLQVTDCQP